MSTPTGHPLEERLNIFRYTERAVSYQHNLTKENPKDAFSDITRRKTITGKQFRKNEGKEAVSFEVNQVLAERQSEQPLLGLPGQMPPEQEDLSVTGLGQNNMLQGPSLSLSGTE